LRPVAALVNAPFVVTPHHPRMASAPRLLGREMVLQQPGGAIAAPAGAGTGRHRAAPLPQALIGRPAYAGRVITPIHEDAQLLVLDKPAGLLAVPGRTEPDCLAARAQARWPDALVVHRLDQATSGLFLMARGAAAQRRLGADFEARRVHKLYVAVVEGELADEAGEIALPLAADWPNRPRQAVDPLRGKPALTRWRLLAREGGTTRLELEPVTGRSHQLRVHLQAIGHPIIGDALYGTPGPRLLLHAARLGLRHPDDGRPVAFASHPPF
jgi:tRNA pseudouridine32 synthase / 23S rRNA pseudouridine746 synthase